MRSIATEGHSATDFSKKPLPAINVKCAALVLSQPHTNKQQAFLLILCTWLNNVGRCWVSNDTIAGALRMHKRTVQRRLAELDQFSGNSTLIINYGASCRETNVIWFQAAGGPPLKVTKTKPTGKRKTAGRRATFATVCHPKVSVPLFPEEHSPVKTLSSSTPLPPARKPEPQTKADDANLQPAAFAGLGIGGGLLPVCKAWEAAGGPRVTDADRLWILGLLREGILPEEIEAGILATRRNRVGKPHLGPVRSLQYCTPEIRLIVSAGVVRQFRPELRPYLLETWRASLEARI